MSPIDRLKASIKFSRSKKSADKSISQSPQAEHQPFLVDVMSARQKIQFYALFACWVAAFILFWNWWLDEKHIVGMTGFVINTFAICWTALMPVYFMFFVSRMKKPNPALQIPKGLRVAMVVTKAPSEPFGLVVKTLHAMLAQKYPHDTWLADEDPSEKMIAWCKNHNVRISCRKGIPEYHNKTWPRRAKCKEGNLAYFYDKYGYDNYDIVAQLDADHIPGENYLEEMLRPFANPAVGYVSAPSLCVSNLEQSWAARGRVYAEANVHGPMQAGYSNEFAPLCIGSHYAVRTVALKQIGGLGPELAEDHSTTYLMNARGWRGVHAFEAEAIGDGPLTFPDFITQEFQWSKSVTAILLTMTPRLLLKLRTKLKFQFLFAQLWYTMLGFTMLICFLIPPVALIMKKPWVNVVYLDFFIHSSLLMASVVAVVIWMKKNGWTRPKNTKVFSWEFMMFQLTRWPWVLLGVLSAIKDLITGKTSEFKVTPKGGNAETPLPLKIIMPYVAIAMASALPAIFIWNVHTAIGYYFFAILNSIIYAVVALAIILLHIHENRFVAKD